MLCKDLGIVGTCGEGFCKAAFIKSCDNINTSKVNYLYYDDVGSKHHYDNIIIV